MKLSGSLHNKITAGEKYIAILFASLFVLFLDFGLSLALPHISLPFKIISALADSCVVATVCMFLKGKWRLAGVVIAFAVGALLLANLLYYRNFDDLLQASSYINADVGDPAITGGAISSFRISDLVFLLTPLCPLAYILWKGRKALESTVRPVWKLSIASILLFSWGISYASVFRRISLWNPNDSLKEVTKSIFSKDCLSWRNAYEMHNFTGYAVKCIVSSFNIGMDLTSSDIEGIRSHLAGRARHGYINAVDSATIHKDKNLIMIIVESLPFKVIEKPEVHEIIPTIMNVIGDSSTVVSRCSVLAGYGRSSDAQFIYNSGLLPLRYEALVDNYARNDYPSLAKALRRTSAEIIGERKGLWNHSLTTKSYGFDHLSDNTAPTGMDQDSLIFKRAETFVSELDPPFYLFITTISMHDPYDEHKVSSEAHPLPDTADERDREYYARLRHFDRSLGRFISVLRQKGIYDDSVIVILGDHEIRASKISTDLHDDAVPFIVINSPLKSKRNIITTQLDVFPSVLDIMGCGYRYLGVDYSGLGQSIFSDEAQAGRAYLPTDMDYRISELIIKGSPSE